MLNVIFYLSQMHPPVEAGSARPIPISAKIYLPM